MKMEFVNLPEERRIYIRNGILMCLENALEHVEEGNKKPMVDLMKKINRDYLQYGYAIAKLTGTIYIRGVKFTSKDNVICIKENGMPMFTIYKDKETGKGAIDFDHIDLLTSDQQREYVRHRVANKSVNM